MSHGQFPPVPAAEIIIGSPKEALTASLVRNSRAALGFRAHSGWAVLVAIAGQLKAPEVLARRRVEMADLDDPDSKQPYHAAERLQFSEAEKLVTESKASAGRMALKGVESAIRDVESSKYAVVTSAILTAGGRALPELKAVLASHALIHAAEGELFREALIRACEHCNLPVRKFREHELFHDAVSSLGISEPDLKRHLELLGKKLGPPWRQDEKYAVLAAWAALGSSSIGRQASG